MADYMTNHITTSNHQQTLSKQPTRKNPIRPRRYDHAGIKRNLQVPKNTLHTLVLSIIGVTARVSGGLGIPVVARFFVRHALMRPFGLAFSSQAILSLPFTLLISGLTCAPFPATSRSIGGTTVNQPSDDSAGLRWSQEQDTYASQLNSLYV